MEKITMIPTAFDAALATDDFIGGISGVLAARDRVRFTEHPSASVSDPRPAGPLV